MALLPIGRGIGNPVSSCRREPTITEILSDSIVQAVMEADGIDPEVLEAELRSMAREISAVGPADCLPCAPATSSSLRHCHELKEMTIGDFEIDTFAAAPIIELGIVSTPRRAAVDEARLLNPMKNGVKFYVGNVERVVVTLEVGVVIEEEGQRVIDFDRREMLAMAFVGKAEELRE